MNSKEMLLGSGLAFVLSFMIMAVYPNVGHAATFTVNSTADVAGLTANCVSGTGQCTLRSAIQAANASGDTDTIILPAGTYTLAIPGTNEDLAANGDLDIRGPGGALTITGAGAATTIIDGGAIEGVLETIVVGGVGANVTISGVTVRNGNSTIGHGGGIHVGNTAAGTSVTLNNVIVTANTAGGGAPGAGGVDNSGTLTMDTVAVTNNTSPGGGVNNGAAGVLTWINGDVSGNTGGGGIQNNGAITLTNITISGNNSTGQGAAIDSDNTATTTLQNVTISGNTSTAGVAPIGGIRNVAGGTVTVRNTILSGNTTANCGGTITSQGNNLDSGTTCAFAGLGDLTNTDPLLGALALNGAVLQPALKTRALLAGSPAIDAGTATGCPATDARGIARPVDGNPVPPAVTAICDMGAYEFRPQKLTVTLPPPFDFGTVTDGTTADHIITLANVGDGALIISPIAVADPLVAPFTIPVDNCSGLTLALGASCTTTARFSPTVAGAAADTFNITSNDPITPVVSFALSGTGSAVPVPGISVSDTITPFNDNSVPFGGVTAGASADATITISNPGTANLVIGTIASANTLAAPFSILNDLCSGKTVAPAGTCTLTVHFAPTATGAFSDTFDIPSNLPAVTMTVSGTGGTTTTGTVNNPPTNPVLVSPTNGQTGVPTTLTFTWKKSLDPDVDAVTYHVMYSTDPNFTTAQTVDVASAKTAGLLFAGLGSLGGGIIMIGCVAGNSSRRSRKTMLGIIALILIGTLFTACGGDGGGTPSTPTTTTPPADQVSTTVTGLAANTTYYWKVVADDGKGGLSSSETFSFTTQ